MPEKTPSFDEFALRTMLFKGRTDWYFCYLKSEKIAQALFSLAELAPPVECEALHFVAEKCASLAGEFAHLAAGEIEAPVVLADVFALLPQARMLGVRGAISKENALILGHELEKVAERLVSGSNPSPFISPEEFSVPVLPKGALPALASQLQESSLRQERAKNTSQGHKGQSERMSLILSFIRKQKSVSIKDIAKVVRGCSEKTIQRELTALINQGLVRKVGERRWSLYTPA